MPKEDKDAVQTPTKRRRTNSTRKTAGASKTHATRRDLTSFDIEEKESGPPGGLTTPTKHGKSASRVQDTDFADLMRSSGMEKMASATGIMPEPTVGTSSQTNTLATPSSAVKTETKAPAPAATTPSQWTPASVASPLSGKKSRMGGKGSKGLRHFSMKVCQKVEEKNMTTYNEVADDLVNEFVTMRPNDAVYDEKNIRRRVYDALNVLGALDIIEKEKKDIRWKGLPSNLQHDTEVLLAEREERQRRIEEKKMQVQELAVRQVLVANLIRRNKENERKGLEQEDTRIHLPFLAVATRNDTRVQVEVLDDRHDAFINCNDTFTAHEDGAILKSMGLHRCSKARVQEILPAHLVPYFPSEFYTDQLES